MGNVFDQGSVSEFDADIEAGNPLDYPGFEEKLDAAKEKTGRKSACVTFEAKIDEVKLVSAVLYAAFRGGSVGAAEGEKFIRALARARRRHYPFLAYVHGTAGIRIQESLNGLIQMPRVTMGETRPQLRGAACGIEQGREELRGQRGDHGPGKGPVRPVDPEPRRHRILPGFRWGSRNKHQGILRAFGAEGGENRLTALVLADQGGIV